MTTQLNPVHYGKAIQYQLSGIVAPVPVYAAFNRNYATQPKFITWMLRNVHQPVYTGQTQSNKGIDRPVFQISIFTQNIEDGFTISNLILQSLHGYSGMFGNPSDDGFFIAKADVNWLYNSYDNEDKLGEIFLDCTLDIPA
jgi:hypothetical protein